MSSPSTVVSCPLVPKPESARTVSNSWYGAPVVHAMVPPKKEQASATRTFISVPRHARHPNERLDIIINRSSLKPSAPHERVQFFCWRSPETLATRDQERLSAFAPHGALEKHQKTLALGLSLIHI